MGEEVDTRSIAICACTFRRPAGLDRLLEGVSALDPVVGTTVHVVICDNDPEQGAQEQVAAAQAGFPYELRYRSQPERGIAPARNAAAEAAGDVDALLFLDDDEWPAPGWLRQMIRVWDETGADIVTGVVLPVFDAPPPRWVLRGRFFDRKRYVTGTPLHYARTSNVLISADVLTRSRLRFRQTPSPGGEDTLFFQEAFDLGHRIVWNDEAVVYESIPATRVRVRWLVRRSFRFGLTRADVLRLTGRSRFRRTRRAARGALTVLVALLRLPLALLDGKAGVVSAAQQAALGAGLVAGSVGVVYNEYAVVHASASTASP